MERLKKINNKKLTYDCSLTADTIHLSATLDNDQRESIYDRFLFNKNNPKFHWRYSQYKTKELGFSINALPYNSFAYKHYDHVLQLQKEVTTAGYIPYSLAELINDIDWNIKRIDLAFDFKTPLENSLIMKHHGNVQFEPSNDKWNTEYLGKLKTRTHSKVANYNRNDKEAERETGIEHEFFNRFEVRLFPTSNDETMKIHNMQDDFILKHLKKYIIIPNIDDLPTSKWNKNRLYKIKADNTYTYFKSLDPKIQHELKEVAKAHRVPLEQIYLQNKHNLFKFAELHENDLIHVPSDELTPLDNMQVEIVIPTDEELFQLFG